MARVRSLPVPCTVAIVYVDADEHVIGLTPGGLRTRTLHDFGATETCVGTRSERHGISLCVPTNARTTGGDLKLATEAEASK